MNIHNIYTRDCFRYGSRWGMRIAWVYVVILDFAVMVFDVGSGRPWWEYVVYLLWFATYGLFIGSILGALAGILTGLGLCPVLHYVKLHAHRKYCWIAGLGTGGLMWLFAYFVGLLIFPPDWHQVFIGYPGVLYVPACAILSQYWCSHMLRNETVSNIKTQNTRDKMLKG